MNLEAPLSTLLEALALSQLELERAEAERERSTPITAQARSLIRRERGGQADTKRGDDVLEG
jgi:hypothetical protein